MGVPPQARRTHQYALDGDSAMTVSRAAAPPTGVELRARNRRGRSFARAFTRLPFRIQPSEPWSVNAELARTPLSAPTSPRPGGQRGRACSFRARCCGAAARSPPEPRRGSNRPSSRSCSAASLGIPCDSSFIILFRSRDLDWADPRYQRGAREGAGSATRRPRVLAVFAADDCATARLAKRLVSADRHQTWSWSR
jgi:hypothetical protein